MLLQSLLHSLHAWLTKSVHSTGLPDRCHYHWQHQLLPNIQEDVPSSSCHDGPQPRRPSRSRGFCPPVQLCIPQRITAHVRTWAGFKVLTETPLPLTKIWALTSLEVLGFNMTRHWPAYILYVRLTGLALFMSTGCFHGTKVTRTSVNFYMFTTTAICLHVSHLHIQALFHLTQNDTNLTI